MTMLHIGILKENEITVVYGKARLYIEAHGGEKFVRFRVVNISKGNMTKVEVDEDYNKRNEDMKCVNFITK